MSGKRRENPAVRPISKTIQERQLSMLQCAVAFRMTAHDFGLRGIHDAQE